MNLRVFALISFCYQNLELRSTWTQTRGVKLVLILRSQMVGSVLVLAFFLDLKNANSASKSHQKYGIYIATFTVFTADIMCEQKHSQRLPMNHT